MGSIHLYERLKGRNVRESGALAMMDLDPSVIALPLDDAPVEIMARQIEAMTCEPVNSFDAAIKSHVDLCEEEKLEPSTIKPALVKPCVTCFECAGK